MTNSVFADETLREAILAAFAADNRIAADNLRVGVLNSIATWQVKWRIYRNVIWQKHSHIKYPVFVVL